MKSKLEIAIAVLEADQFDHGEWGRCESAHSRTLDDSRAKPNLFTSSEAALSLVAAGRKDAAAIRAYLSWVRNLKQNDGWWWSAAGSSAPGFEAPSWVRNIRHTAKALDVLALADELSGPEFRAVETVLRYQLECGAYPQFPGGEPDLWSTLYAMNLVLRLIASSRLLKLSAPSGTLDEEWESTVRTYLERARGWVISKLLDGERWSNSKGSPTDWWVTTAVAIEAGADLSNSRPDICRRVSDYLFRGLQGPIDPRAFWGCLAMWPALTAVQRQTAADALLRVDYEEDRSTLAMACRCRLLALSGDATLAHVYFKSARFHSSALGEWNAWREASGEPDAPLSSRDKNSPQSSEQSRRQPAEPPMRQQPPVTEIKRLFAASGGRCAFPDCTTELMPETGGSLAEIAHICADSPGGPRFDLSQSKEERQAYQNLIVLCPTHHALVDAAPETYGASVLREMKSRHELQVREILRAPKVQSTVLEDSAATQLARQVDPSATDFAIVTALQGELSAVLAQFPTLQKVVVGRESRTYFQGTVTANDGVTKYRIVATLLHGMGNVEAAAATSDVIRDWSPRYVVMCGIAGGLQSETQHLGDVVVSTDVVYYELGKLRDTGLERRPVSYRADALLLDRAMHMHQGSSWRTGLPKRPDCLSDTDLPRVSFAPVASGEKVIASAADAASLLAIHPKLAAVEMEGIGVATSAFAAAHRVGFLMVRSICDFADSAKGDSWQSYAAHVAASFLRELIASRPIAPVQGEWQPQPSEEASADPQWVRTVLFPKLSQALNMEQLRDFCYLIHVDVDDLEGTTKRGKIRELLLRAERRGRLQEIVKAYEQLVRDDW